MSRVIPLIVLLGVSIGVLGCTQELGRVTASAQKPVPIKTARVGPPELPDAVRSPWARDFLREGEESRGEALRAAQIDPGILMYTDPPPGTDMPVYMPPKNVDPGIFWGDPRLRRIKPDDSCGEAAIGPEQGC